MLDGCFTTLPTTATIRLHSVTGSRTCSILLAGVARTIHTESSVHRAPEFAAWWRTADRSAQQSIHDMRNAELKELRRSRRLRSIP